MRTVTADELQQLLAEHKRWLRGDGGSRADLSGAVLSGAVLRHADLSGADLSGADLSGAVLRHADLSDADLSGADLSGAVLRHADLSGAVLRHADLSGADLSDGRGLDAIPLIKNLDAKTLAIIEHGDGTLEMGQWHHPCGTEHCRAGWAIVHAGEAGKAMEALVGPATAGALLYARAYPGMPIPNFYASNEVALADIRERAKLAEESA